MCVIQGPNRTTATDISDNEDFPVAIPSSNTEIIVLSVWR